MAANRVVRVVTGITARMWSDFKREEENMEQDRKERRNRSRLEDSDDDDSEEDVTCTPTLDVNDNLEESEEIPETLEDTFPLDEEGHPDAGGDV